MPARAEIASSARAEDLGLLALRDVAEAAKGSNYRIIGGHMVRLLTHVYGVPQSQPRITRDADAGIDCEIAASARLHHDLLAAGYVAESGNHYTRDLGTDRDKTAIDLLIPVDGDRGARLAGERRFDAAPGLNLALSQQAVSVHIAATLTSGEHVERDVLVPDVEAATVLKLGATEVRTVDKDVQDLLTLLSIVHGGPELVTGPWRINEPQMVRRGERLDAARAAVRLRGRPGIAPLLSALLLEYVAEPPRS